MSRNDAKRPGRPTDEAKRDAILGEGAPGLFTIEHLTHHPGYLVELDVSQKMGWGMFIGATVLTIITVLVV